MTDSVCPHCHVTQYSLLTDHNIHSKSEPFHGSIGQFCAAFYHVPQGPGVTYDCLTDECKIHKEINEKHGGHGMPSNLWTPPKKVVAVVKFEETEANGNSFARRYTNCYASNRHAEEYFKLDVENNENLRLDIENNINKITMYITFQPCHNSVDTGATSPNYSCCNILESLMEEEKNRLFEDVKIIIKPTHTYKANQEHSDDDRLNTEISKALEGMNKLINVGIKFDRMNDDDWNYLRQQMVQDNEQFHPSDKREALDNEIGTFLTTLGGGPGGGAGDSGTTSGGTDHSGTTSSGTGHSGGGSSSSQSVPTRPTQRSKEKARKPVGRKEK